MSRNKNRLGATQRDATPPPQNVLNSTEAQQSAPLSFVVPTEFVDLPSGGRYYPEGHPLHGQTCLEIKQMTAKEEDILTSRTLLKKGIALDRVIESVIVSPGVNPADLLIGDRNAIIVATRVSGYGNEYSTSVTCPSCSNTQKYDFDLNESTVYHGEDAHELDLIDHEDGTFSTTLPRTQFEVCFRLLTGRDEKLLMDYVEKARKKKGLEKNITSQLLNIVVSINGESERSVINQVVDVLPSMDARHLRAAYKLAAPNVDLSQHFECGECDYEETMEVPLTADFFGLTAEYMENVYEQFFFLKYSGGWSFIEAYSLPVGLRTWFVERLVKQIEDENAAMEQASKGGGSSAQTLNSANQPSVPGHYSKKY